MENNNKNIAIADITNIKHAIDELRIVDTKVLSRLKKINIDFNSYLSKVYSDADDIFKIMNMYDTQLHYHKIFFLGQEKRLNDNYYTLINIDNSIRDKIEIFEKLTEEIDINKLLDKFMDQINSVSRFNDNWVISFEYKYSSLKMDIDSKLSKINESIKDNMRITFEKIDSEFSSLNAKINNEAINLNTKKIDCLNKTTQESLKKLNEYNDNIEKLYKKSFILIIASSLVLGGTLCSTLIWLIINKL